MDNPATYTVECHNYCLNLELFVLVFFFIKKQSPDTPPTVAELDVQLESLVYWRWFGFHLRKIGDSEDMAEKIGSTLR